MNNLFMAHRMDTELISMQWFFLRSNPFVQAAVDATQQDSSMGADVELDFWNDILKSVPTGETQHDLSSR